MKSGAPVVRVQATNLLNNERLWPSGYSYQFFVRGAGGPSLDGISYYYPLATRSVFVTLDVTF